MRARNRSVSRIVCSCTSSSTQVNSPLRPGSSAIVLPAIRSATYSASARCAGLLRIRVGTLTEDRMSLTSASFIVRKNESAAPGLRLRRMCPTNQLSKASSPTRAGAQSRNSSAR